MKCKICKGKLGNSIIDERYHECSSCGVYCLKPSQPFDKEYYTKGKGVKYGVRQKILFKLPFTWRHRHTIRMLQGLGPAWALDVGCKEGKLMKALERKGWRLDGIEPTKFWAMYSKVYHTSLEEYAKEHPSSSFDVVILSAVLEHVQDQHGFIQAALDCTNDVVFIRIPHKDSGWFDPTHPYLHSATSISLLLYKHGASIESFETHGREFYIVARKNQ